MSVEYKQLPLTSIFKKCETVLIGLRNLFHLNREFHSNVVDKDAIEIASLSEI